MMEERGGEMTSRGGLPGRGGQDRGGDVLGCRGGGKSSGGGTEGGDGLGSWEEWIQVLWLELVAEEEMMAEAAKLGSPNPGACYHCRNWKQECVQPR